MRLVIITPVGPGHEVYAERAIKSVHEASWHRVGFTSVRHVVVSDKDGKLGRSKARNIGMADDADWYFFLDADDRLRGDALTRNDFEAPATFGSLSLNGRPFISNVWPCGWREVALHGARGTLSMGFFVRADLAQRLRFDEAMDRGEDFDFYMRLPGFTKLAEPLVDIGYDLPSAGGPRGYDSIDWIGICNAVVAKAVMKDPNKYDVSRDAVLGEVNRPLAQPGDLSRPVCV